MAIHYEVILTDGEFTLTILCKDADAMVRIADAMRRHGKSPICARIATPVEPGAEVHP